jgi:ABC-type nitrate/sulfonate/bicarbonate transport system ATPase subunit
MVPLEITGLTKIFETPSGILGHSGCGKSTVLSIIAGLQKATHGGVIIQGKQVGEPGTDRGMVFQSPCLLPWLTAGENVALAVGQGFPNAHGKERKERAEKWLELAGIAGCYNQKPSELSLGTQQCVSLARALREKCSQRRSQVTTHRRFRARRRPPS